IKFSWFRGNILFQHFLSSAHLKDFIMKRFEGKTAIVTGSTSGIGLGIERKLASEGGHVIINSYRERKDIEEILDYITEEGGEAHFIRADIGKMDEVQELIREAFERFEKIDILINNAGIQMRSSFLEVTEKDFDRVLSVNLKGVYFTIQAFVKHAIDREIKGVIVNNSSVHEILPFPHFDS